MKFKLITNQKITHNNHMKRMHISAPFFVLGEKISKVKKYKTDYRAFEYELTKDEYNELIDLFKRYDTKK